MEEKRSPNSGSRHENPEQSQPKNRVEDEFTEFEELISSEENVEYEENGSFEILENKDRLEKRNPVGSRGVRVTQIGDGADQHVEIPLQIELPGGVTEDVLLNIVISLQKVRKQENPYPGSGPEDSFRDEDSEIDILDGRTALVFDENAEEDEEDKDSSEESWIDKIFSFWKKDRK